MLKSAVFGHWHHLATLVGAVAWVDRKKERGRRRRKKEGSGAIEASKKKGGGEVSAESPWRSFSSLPPLKGPQTSIWENTCRFAFKLPVQTN